MEVATFRSDHSYQDGRRPGEVRFETNPKQDALRRDFTINALFLDPETDEILDFVGGRADLADGIIRAIGDSGAAFPEDYLRMLRAVRFAARLDFEIEPGNGRSDPEDEPRSSSMWLPSESAMNLSRILTEGGAKTRV